MQMKMRLLRDQITDELHLECATTTRPSIVRNAKKEMEESGAIDNLRNGDPISSLRSDDGISF